MLLQFVEGYKQKNAKQEQKQKHRCTGTYIQSLDRSQQTILKKSNNDDINTLQCNSDNYKIVPYYMKFWRHVNLAILKSPYLATL